MKKFSVIFVAVVFALSLAVPAMAVHVGSLDTGPTPAVDEGFSISGGYTFDAEDYTTNAGVQSQAYDDDLEVVLKVNKGDVTVVVDLEIADDAQFDGDSIRGGGDLIDNYYVMIGNFIADGLSLKIGEYGISHGRKIGFYSQGNRNIGIKYSLDQADLALYLGKLQEAAADPDADNDLLTLQASLKGIDALKKANLTYASRTNEASGSDAGFIGVDIALDAGPIPIAFEYNSISSDIAANDGGTALFLSGGFNELLGFNVNLNYFTSNQEFSDAEFGDYWYPLSIYGDKVNGDSGDETTMIWVDGSYKYSDELTLKGAVLIQGTTNDTGLDESIGTEIDIHAVYKVSGNTSLQLTYATWAPGDAYPAPNDETATQLKARLKAKF